MPMRGNVRRNYKRGVIKGSFERIYEMGHQEQHMRGGVQMRIKKGLS